MDRLSRQRRYHTHFLHEVMAKTATLYVLDGTAALFRAYYGMNSVTAPDGTEVGGLLGLGQWVGRFLKVVSPMYVASVMDSPERTFRHEIFPEYKAQRAAMPEDLSIALPYLFRLCEAFNLNVIRVPGWEADDVIGTLAKQAEEEDFSTFMVTPDKDFGQLVSERTNAPHPAAAPSLCAETDTALTPTSNNWSILSVVFPIA